MRFPIGYLAVSAILVLAPARAQNVRITSVKGKVSVVRGGANWPVPAAQPFDLVAGDRLVTARRAQATVHLDAAHVVDLGSNGEVELMTASPGQYALSLARGAVQCHVLDLSTAVVDIATPSVGIRPAQPGEYIISLNSAGESEIEARAGLVEVFAPGGPQPVVAGQRMIARGPAANPEFRIYSTSAWRRLVALFSNLNFGGGGGGAAATVAVESGGDSGGHHEHHPEQSHAPASAGGRGAVPVSTHGPADTGSHAPAPHAPAPAPAADHSAPATRK